MLLIRRFEEKVEERFRAGDLAGFLHVAIGQEAIAVGVCRALRGRRRDRLDPSRPRAHARDGDAPERADGRAVREGRGLQRRLRRLDAPLRRRARPDRRERGRRRRAPCDHRRRAFVQAPRRAARGGRVLRRRRDEHRDVPRVAEPRAALEGSRGVRLREQRLRRVDAGLAAASDPGPLEACRRVRDAHDRRRRPGDRGGVRGRAACD